MAASRTPFPLGSDDAGSNGSSDLARFLYRPIVFAEPERLVHPPSWLEHIPFAFWIVDVLQPRVFVELGTQSGNSYAAFAQAVQTLGLATACYAVDTWQGDAQAGFYDESVFTEWAAYHDRHFEAFSRLVRSTFAEAVSHFSDRGIDLIHLDGYHTYDATLADFDQWLPKLSSRGVIVLHDINVREQDFGVWRLWEALQTQFPSFGFLHGNGLGVLAVGSELPEPLKWLLSRTATSPDDVRAVRQFFGHVGGLISARFAADAELARHRPDAQMERDGQVQALMSRVESLADEIRIRDARLAERDATIATLTSDVNRFQQHLSKMSTDFDARVAQAMLPSVRLSGLEDALVHATGLVAELRARLRTESDRRRQLGIERHRLAAQLAARSSDLAERTAQLADWSTTRWRISHRTAALLRHVQTVETSGPGRGIRRLHAVASTLGAMGLSRSNGTLGSPRRLLKFLSSPRRIRDAYVVAASGLFDEDYYRTHHPDVAASRMTPLAHFVLEGAREARNAHPLFDCAWYAATNSDVAQSGENPLVHYILHGAREGRPPHPLFAAASSVEAGHDGHRDGNPPDLRREPLAGHEGRAPYPWFDPTFFIDADPTARPAAAEHDVEALEGLPESQVAAQPEEQEGLAPDDIVDGRTLRLNVRSLVRGDPSPATVLCVSHVMPWPPRAGNEYRLYRMLCWLRDQGYRIVPVIAPLGGERVASDDVRALADRFGTAVLCYPDGCLDYVLGDIPDVLASLQNEFTRPIADLLNEDAVHDPRERELLQADRTFCHDALITTVLRLLQLLSPSVLLAEYIWMSRLLPLVTGDVLKVIDTVDVFSSKREKVLQFGIDEWHVEPHEEVHRLQRADLVIAVQQEEQQTLQALVPHIPVLTAGVDFDAVEDPGLPSARRILYVSSDNAMNRRGLQDFLRFAWPLIQRDVPDAELLLIGKIGRTLADDIPGVVRVGLVDDLRPLYRKARVVINPAVAGTGLKIKTLEALCHFRPIVTWPSGTDGLAPELAALCETVHDWYAFARRVSGVLVNDNECFFSSSQRNTIVSLTSAATVYCALTSALERFFDSRSRLERQESAVHV